MTHWHEKGLITLIMAAISVYLFQILLGVKINSFVLQTLLNVFCG